MLTLFKKLFGKSEPRAAAPIAIAVPAAPSTPLPTVEVAHLSLAAIVARFPEELKPLLLREPDAAASVALPVPNILKQLHTGTVKMSLASLQRQAHGLIQPLNPGDKRTVEIPLAEIFRHVRPHALKRRPDQRPVAVPENGFNLFGDSMNPYAVAPDDHIETVTASQVLDLAPDAPRVLKMDEGLRDQFPAVAPATSPPAPAAPAVAAELKLETPPAAPAILAPPPEFSAPKPVAITPPVAKPEGPTLALKIAPLAAGWPDDIRAEVEALDPETTVVLPVSEVTTGLAKGRVIFTWAQIHAWLEPQAAPTAAAVSTSLQLPLKIVAPAFLAVSKKPQAERRSLEVDATIPALFSGGRAPAPESAPAPVVPSAPATSTAPAAPPEAAPAPVEPAAPVAVADSDKLPETVGEMFGQPHKKTWTPAELVAGAVKLPGVAGAVVALQEGLQVAASLPDGVKSEVIAAFLPQIFARLNQYSGEMKLGEVDDLLFTTHGAHCQIYRLGFVYLAVLGKPGESLPWHALRLITEELARQTHK
jgi:predicted regulator of Ras-like GTPase activity (Roadblock/LC7/MglB family)